MVSDSKDISYTFWGQNRVKAIKKLLAMQGVNSISVYSHSIVPGGLLVIS